MRESSPNQFVKKPPVSSLKTEAKSLFREILAISPYGSRFCPDRLISTNANSNEMRILGRYSKKMWGECIPGSPERDEDRRLSSAPGQSEISLACFMAGSYRVVPDIVR